MHLGFLLRRCFGPWERPIAFAYRSAFVDLDSLVRQIGSWLPDLERRTILEVGAGEGLFVQRLAHAYPKTQIQGIDVSPHVGRLFRGAQPTVSFRRQTVNEYAAQRPASVDVIIISDVLHHVVQQDLHLEILIMAQRSLKPGGFLILKDWEPTNTLIHLLCYALERYVTGDRVVYWGSGYFKTLVRSVFGAASIQREARVGPWRNNFVLLARNLPLDRL